MSRTWKRKRGEGMRGLFFLVTLFVATASGDWQLVWSDEFDGSSIDRSKWDFEVNCWGGGNGEKQCYVDSTNAVFVQNGVLNLHPTYYANGYQGSSSGCTLDNEGSCTWTQPVTSGRIRTLNCPTGNWLYGRFEIRAKLPRGDFLWPAIWMLPNDYAYGSWAASGEIDIMEFRGQDRQVTEHTLHFGGAWPNNVWEGSGPLDNGVDLTNDFHTYAVEWEAGEIRWYIDTTLKRSATLDRDFWSGKGTTPYTAFRQPFDKRFHLILNLAIAGGFFGSNYGTFDAATASATWTQNFMIDYVRMYQQYTPTVASTSAPTSNPGSWEMIWNDEFDGSSIDRSKWDFDVNCWGGGNNEQQCYVDNTNNVFIQNGALNIHPIYFPNGFTGSATGCTNNNDNSCTATKPTTSGKIRTLNSLSGSWTFGRFEIRAKLPKGDFLWPAIWMLPTDSVYGSWAASGHIDLMEFRGQDRQKLEYTLHYGGAWPNNVHEGTGKLDMGVDLTNDFHIFALEWEETEIRWYIDKTLKYSVSLEKSFWSGLGTNPYTAFRQPFDQRFHLILDLAIAGTFFDSSYGTFNASTASATWTQDYIIDFVRVYRRVSSPTSAPTTVPSSSTDSSSAATLLPSFLAFFASLFLLSLF